MYKNKCIIFWMITSLLGSVPLLCAVYDDNLLDACRVGELDTVIAILKTGRPINCGANAFYMAPLHAAAYAGQEAIVQLLFNRGAFIDIQDGRGDIPLHFAAKSRTTRSARRAVVSFLLSEGSTVNSANQENETPLSYAVRCNDEHVIRQLLRAGATVSVPSRRNRTPLHWAAICCHSEVVRLLLAAGAREVINWPDNEGKTPLYGAMSGAWNSELQKTVRLLLAAGADIDYPTTKGERPLDRASFFGNEELIEFLLEHGACLPRGMETENRLAVVRKRVLAIGAFLEEWCGISRDVICLIQGMEGVPKELLKVVKKRKTRAELSGCLKSKKSRRL